MSKYTTEVRYICEQSAGLTESVGFNSIDSVLENCLDKVFDFSFPIFDENYRSVLEAKILRHYYTREICCETVGLWKHFLCNRLNEIMPYYNKLYESELLEFDPLFDVDLTIDHHLGNNKTGKEDVTDEMTGTVADSGTTGGTISDHREYEHNTNDTTRDKYSDTPQGALNGVEDMSYLTNARIVNEMDTHNGYDNNTRTLNTTNGNTRTYNTTNETGRNNSLLTTENYLEHIRGKRGGISFSKLLEEYRKTLLNIDLLIINDLSDLFFSLW